MVRLTGRFVLRHHRFTFQSKSSTVLPLTGRGVSTHNRIVNKINTVK